MATVVAKIGSSSLTDDAGVIDLGAVVKLCQEVVALRDAGHRAVIVSSGAVAAGVAAIGLDSRPTDMPTLQALSAAGQSRLMQVYNDFLAHYGAVGAQVLLTSHSFVNRRPYLHARQTLLRLLELGCVPIVNENDAIAVDELRYGDNDRIAALVSHLVAADLLVLLTDTDGLYTSDPRVDGSARLIGEVAADDPIFSMAAGGTGSDRGSGGMASKLAAARIASWSGVRAVIANALAPERAGRQPGRGPGLRHHLRAPRPPHARPQALDRVRQRLRRHDHRRRRRSPGPRRAGRLPAAGGGARRGGRLRRRRSGRRGHARRRGVRPRHRGRRHRDVAHRSRAGARGTCRPRCPTRSSTATTSSYCPPDGMVVRGRGHWR